MFFMSEGDGEDAQSQDNPMQSGGELGGGFDSFLWGGELEKDDEYISETGEPEYGPTGDDLDRLVHTQSELQPFLLKPVPEGYVMRCIVKREKKMLGLGENIVLCIQEPGVWQNDKKHHRVLLAQKKQKSSTLNMHINLPEIMGRQRLAKIRSLDKKEYTLFDEGKKKDRKELGSCKVTTAGPTKPITLECVVKLQEELFVNNISLETIQPKYNKDKGSFFLPFERVGERVTMNSRHNFLMKKVEDSGKKKKKPLQLGKVDHGVFALDVRTPLTPLHAFYIILCHMQE